MGRGILYVHQASSLVCDTVVYLRPPASNFYCMHLHMHVHVYIPGVKLDHSSCEVLETVLSRVHANSLDLEKANLEDEVGVSVMSALVG